MTATINEARMTLREFFDAFYDKADLSAGSLRGIESKLRLWERLTSNPAIGDIDDVTAAGFRESLVAEQLRGSTVNTTMRFVRTVLRVAAPPDTGNPRGKSIIGKVPYFKLVREHRETPRRVKLEEFDAAYQACDNTYRPCLDIAPPDFWRALIVTGYFTGLRKSDILRIRWSDIDLAENTITFTASKTHKADELLLHPIAANHLRRIVTPREFVFGGLVSSEVFASQWRVIMRYAVQTMPKFVAFGRTMFDGRPLAKLNASGPALADCCCSIAR